MAKPGRRPGTRKTGGRQKGTLNRGTLEKREAHRLRMEERRRLSPEMVLARREVYYRQRYGIGVADYDAMLLKQHGACAACGTTDPGHASGLFCVDHDHVTGVVRDLLCVACNAIVGYVEKQGPRVATAFDYVARHARLAKVVAK